MRAKYLGIVGQGGQLAQRIGHLARCAFEQAAAAARKQGVAGKQPRCAAALVTLAHVGDMPFRMAGYVDDGHLQAQFGHVCDIAFGKRFRDGCDSLIAWAEDGYGEMLQQFRHATRVVGVVMRE
ncbi:hypothetical protein D3C85_632430 [compost metagenome]